MNATTIGVDLAKNVFVACVGDGTGRLIETREFNRSGFLAWLSSLPRGTVIGMEACSGAHCWGRAMAALGLAPRLMAADFVRAYRKRQSVKNDRADAAAILATLHAPGKPKLGRITRRGDSYLRSLLVQGARSVFAATLRKARSAPDTLTRLQQWIVGLNARVGYHKTLVAIANKHARQLWAVLAKGETYNPEAWRQWGQTAEQPAA